MKIFTNILSVTILLLLMVTVSCNKPTPEVQVDDRFFVNLVTSTSLNAQDCLEKMTGMDEDIAQSIGRLLPDTEILVESITYQGVAPDGTAVVASGIIARPKKGNPIGEIAAFHPTIGHNALAPSVALFSTEAIYAFLGYSVFICDYIGFGSTAYLPHPYMHLRNTSLNTFYFVMAAHEYLKGEGVKTFQDMYAVGYSQGGAAVLDFANLVATYYPDEFHLRKIYSGGAPVDLVATMDHYIEEDKCEFPFGILATVLGLDCGDQLNLTYTSVLQGEALANYEDWVLSKSYDAEEANGFFSSNKTSSILHPAFYTEKKNADIDKLTESLYKNSVNNGDFDWNSTAPIQLLHSKADNYIPYINATKAQTFFKAHNVPVDLKSLILLNHRSAGAYFYLYLLEELPRS